MTMFRSLALGLAGAAVLAVQPAAAQFYLKAKEFTGTRASADEPGLAQPMPGATPAEQRAGLVWTMRAALNVAALQCQFEPTLLTVQNYNAILADHRAELAASFATLDGYFARTSGNNKKKGQTLLDQYGTRTYSSFATVAGQLNFCRVAGMIGNEAIMRPRGAFGDLALDRIRELRASMTPFGEQQFGQVVPYVSLPRAEKNCWSGNTYKEACGYVR